MLSPGQTERKDNASLEVRRACVLRLAMGDQTGSQVDSSSTQVAKKAISVQPYALARTKENNSKGVVTSNNFSCNLSRKKICR